MVFIAAGYSGAGSGDREEPSETAGPLGEYAARSEVGPQKLGDGLRDFGYWRRRLGSQLQVASRFNRDLLDLALLPGDAQAFDAETESPLHQAGFAPVDAAVEGCVDLVVPPRLERIGKSCCDRAVWLDGEHGAEYFGRRFLLLEHGLDESKARFGLEVEVGERQGLPRAGHLTGLSEQFAKRPAPGRIGLGNPWGNTPHQPRYTSRRWLGTG